MPGRSLHICEAKAIKGISGPFCAAVNTLFCCRNSYRQSAQWAPSAAQCKTAFTPKRRDSCGSRIIIESSKLLREHLQHVCLVLDRKSVSFNNDPMTRINRAPTRGENTMMLLASFKSLKTLEVVFDLSDLGRDLAPGHSQGATAIAVLEKVVTRWYVRAESINNATTDRILEDIPQLEVVKEEFEKLAPAASEEKEQRSYKFDQHIGVHEDYGWPPCSYQI
ncbi:hypothetical protein QBC32DRAFT_367759 [Pseudoneurospora amorphoporcata]|uniref:Uncharacterized protein n=1 Tax=Pseudoneurospora amorphoporcata TaxID=241081 RepID=A0AAN6P0E4_9PEZI|nr:hypothetical protein QBC32DRAFT_367759 [Pseudoneurospora amorphoporcata]